MRDVLVVTPDFPPEVGGIQTLTSQLVSAFTQYEPRVVAPEMDGAGDFDDDLSFTVKRAASGNGAHRLRIVSLNGVGFVEAIRTKPDVILAMHVMSGPCALAAGGLLRRPVVLYAHGQELGAHPRLTRTVLRRPDVVIAVSRHTRSLVQRLGRDARVRVVHPGIAAPSGGESANGRGNSVIVVARLEERYKGHDILLRAMASVRKRVPGAHLHVVGDGSLRTELEAVAREAGVAGATTFHGAVSDDARDELLRRSAVFAMPSRLGARGAGEGFGIAYVEAGSQGLPVVAGRVGGAVDAVADGETGLLVDPRDEQAVADAITSLLLDPERARRLGDAGRRRAESLSWPRVAAEVEAVLDEVVS